MPTVHRCFRAVLPFALGCALAAHETNALAQSTAPTGPSESALAARRGLVGRAQQAAAAGRHQEALDQAESAGRIEMTPSLRMFIAQERQALGMHASALEAAEQCVREATRNTALERREIILNTCRELSRGSQERVVFLTVNWSERWPTGITVRLGRHTLELREFGAPIVADAGVVQFEVSAPNIATHSEQLTVPAGSSRTIAVPERFMQPAAVAANTTHTNTTANTTTTATAPNTTSGPQQPHTSDGGNQSGASTATGQPLTVTPPPTTNSGRFVAGLVIGIAGVGLGAGLGLAFWQLREGQVSAYNSDPMCPGTSAMNQGSESCQTRINAGNTYGTLIPIVLVVGGLTVAGGAVLMATSGRAQEPRQRPVVVAPWISPSILGMSAGAVF